MQCDNRIILFALPNGLALANAFPDLKWIPLAIHFAENFASICDTGGILFIREQKMETSN